MYASQLCDLRYRSAALRRTPAAASPPSARCHALRAPKHEYGGPLPFGAGHGVLRWEDEAAALYRAGEKVEREKEWKRTRYSLIRNANALTDKLSAQQEEEIRRMRAKVRLRKFWDLMNEQDRPWHYDAILHLVSGLSGEHSRRAYRAVTAGTMQGILAQRAKAERDVRERRDDAAALFRRIASTERRMLATSQPVDSDVLLELEREAGNVQADTGTAAAGLLRLRRAAAGTFQDADYCAHVDGLLRALQRVGGACRSARAVQLPALRMLAHELYGFQGQLQERALPRDRVVSYTTEVRRRAPMQLPALWQDEDLPWRYPPLPYVVHAYEARRAQAMGADIPPQPAPFPAAGARRLGRTQGPGLLGVDGEEGGFGDSDDDAASRSSSSSIKGAGGLSQRLPPQPSDVDLAELDVMTQQLSDPGRGPWPGQRLARTRPEPGSGAGGGSAGFGYGNVDADADAWPAAGGVARGPRQTLPPGEAPRRLQLAAGVFD